MRPVVVIILHAPSSGVGRLSAACADARLALAERHAAGFRAAGAADVRIIADPDARPFGARLRAVAAGLPAGAGLVVLGSGSLPLASAGDRRAFVAAAADPDGPALANNRYSGDAIAVPDAARVLAAVPDLPGDNALPRWLDERAGRPVRDVRGRAHLQADLDGVADLALLIRSRRCPAALRDAADVMGADLAALDGRLDAIARVGTDRRAEIVVAGRVSAAGLAHLEHATAGRVRALVEERGLRAADPRALADPVDAAAGAEPAPQPFPAHGPRPVQRPPASVLGMLLDRDGPQGLGPALARLGDAALVDSRVLLAHRLGADERLWPPLEDRLASDLGLAAAVADPWLRALTESADAAGIPVALGGHSLVGPGLRLLFSTSRGARRPGARR